MDMMIRVTKYHKNKKELKEIAQWFRDKGVKTEFRWNHGNAWVALYREILPTDSKRLIKAYRE